MTVLLLLNLKVIYYNTMVLTNQDLQKINNLISKRLKWAFSDFLLELFKYFPTKLEVAEMIDVRLDKRIRPMRVDISQLKDDVASIKNELTTEHELRYSKLEEVSDQTEKNTNDIRLMKVKRQIRD